MIRVLIDEGISRDIARDLRSGGYEVVHALDLGLKSQSDPVVFHAAQSRSAAICTKNRDDYVLLASAWREWRLGTHHGIITPRRGPQPTNDTIQRALEQILALGAPLTDRVVYF